MEEIKMYELEWSGRVDRSVSEVTEILGDAVKKCVDIGVGANDKWSVTSTPLGEIFIKIVTKRKESAIYTSELMKEKEGISLKLSEIKVSPLPFEVAAGSSENRERGLFPIARDSENKFSGR